MVHLEAYSTIGKPSLIFNRIRKSVEPDEPDLGEKGEFRFNTRHNIPVLNREILRSITSIDFYLAISNFHYNNIRGAPACHDRVDIS